MFAQNLKMFVLALDAVNGFWNFIFCLDYPKRVSRHLAHNKNLKNNKQPERGKTRKVSGEKKNQNGQSDRVDFALFTFLLFCRLSVIILYIT